MLTMITGFYAYLIKKNAELQHQPRVFAEFTGAGDKRRVWIRFKNIGGSLAADISLSICPAIARETGPPAERVFIHALEPGQPYHLYAGEVEPDFVNQNDTVNFQLDYKDMYGKNTARLIAPISGQFWNGAPLTTAGTRRFVTGN